MATFTVTTAADAVSGTDGRLSLREAVERANANADADTIRFASRLEGQTLTLAGGELVLSQDVTVDGDRNDDGVHVTIDGNRTSRIFKIAGTGTDVGLTDLTLTHGDQNSDGIDRLVGGAVFLSGGRLTVTGSAITGNEAIHTGGGIFADNGIVTVISSQINNNRAQYSVGGGIAAYDANVTIRHSEVSGNSSYYAGSAIYVHVSSLVIEHSRINDNSIGGYVGHAIESDGTVSVARTTISGNYGGGVEAEQLTLSDSTIANNHANYSSGGGIAAGGLVVRNCTITGNVADAFEGDIAHGGGIFADRVDIANSIVAGNSLGPDASGSPDIWGKIVLSNGHNVFGSDVDGNVPGDLENVAASALFAALDPRTGGGLLGEDGLVRLLKDAANPAVSAADPLAASATGQLGAARPLPVGSLADLGSVEIRQPLSTTASLDNDVLSGGGHADTINGLAGADWIRGLAGNDTLRGGHGGDLLDGGRGDDELYGDAGTDILYYGGPTGVAVDLGLGKAVRGGETDRLHGIEGAIGSSADDVFKGDGGDNSFHGGLGRDTSTGGGGRDLYDYDRVADSRPDSTRDVIRDFVHLTDRIDLMGIDADTTVPGDQAFHWVGTAALAGPGEVGYFTAGGTTIIQASTDADGTAEFQIQLTGIKTLTAVDFYL